MKLVHSVHTGRCNQWMSGFSCFSSWQCFPGKCPCQLDDRATSNSISAEARDVDFAARGLDPPVDLACTACLLNAQYILPAFFHLFSLFVNICYSPAKSGTTRRKQAASLRKRDLIGSHTILGCLGVWGYFWGI